MDRTIVPGSILMVGGRQSGSWRVVALRISRRGTREGTRHKLFQAAASTLQRRCRPSRALQREPGGPEVLPGAASALLRRRWPSRALQKVPGGAQGCPRMRPAASALLRRRQPSRALQREPGGSGLRIPTRIR